MSNVIYHRNWYILHVRSGYLRGCIYGILTWSMYPVFCIAWLNLVPRVSLLPSRGREEERPWERGCAWLFVIFSTNSGLFQLAGVRSHTQYGPVLVFLHWDVWAFSDVFLVGFSAECLFLLHSNDYQTKVRSCFLGVRKSLSINI